MSSFSSPPQPIPQKHIKDILPKDTPFSLLFEIIKKLSQQQQGVLYQISDETGTAKLKIKPTLTKFIQEGKVYTAHNLMPVVKEGKIVLELKANVGSLTKEPMVLPFKDHTYDLSEVEWKEAVKEVPKVEEKEKQKEEKKEKKQESKPIQSQKSTSSFNSSAKYQPHPKPSFPSYTSSYQPKPQFKYIQKQPQTVPKKYTTTKPSFARLTNLKQFQQSQLVDVLVHVSGIKLIQKETKGKWRKFIQCKLSDNTGTVTGSFFDNAKVYNGECFEVRNIKLRFFKGRIELQQTVETNIRYNGEAKISANYRQVQVYNDKY